MRLSPCLTRTATSVQFMFECVTDLRKFGGQGCILADDMVRAFIRCGCAPVMVAFVRSAHPRTPIALQGLGKTLQAITLMWTLLNQGFYGNPIAKRAIIVCPTSLVSNWDSECEKWLKGRVKTTPIAESTRADVISAVTQFLSPRNTSHVLIVSYETFRLHAVCCLVHMDGRACPVRATHRFFCFPTCRSGLPIPMRATCSSATRRTA
jgi:DNA repair and recombination RAD54-like protein